MNKTINEIYLDYFNFLNLKNKETTILFIKRKFDNYIIPFFGSLRLSDISEKNILDFMIQIKELNYSNSFYRQMSSILINFFEYLNVMYSIENIPKRVCKLITYNKTNVSIKKDYFTKKEFNKFIHKVDNNVYHALFNVLFYCGLRKGEALALSVRDLKGRYLHINHTITKELFDGKRLITTPKSKKSIRKIKIDIFTYIELKKLIRYYNTHYNNFNDNFFLFGGDKPISFTTLERKKNIYCDLAKVKRIRIHDFRHSHATMLYNKKIDIKTIQSRLGHADIGTTLNTYIHNDLKQEKRLIKKINLIRL